MSLKYLFGIALMILFYKKDGCSLGKTIIYDLPDDLNDDMSDNIDIELHQRETDFDLPLNVG